MAFGETTQQNRCVLVSVEIDDDCNDKIVRLWAVKQGDQEPESAPVTVSGWEVLGVPWLRSLNSYIDKIHRSGDFDMLRILMCCTSNVQFRSRVFFQHIVVNLKIHEIYLILANTQIG